MTIIGDWSHSGHLVMRHHSGGQERVISLSGNKDDYTLDSQHHGIMGTPVTNNFLFF